MTADAVKLRLRITRSRAIPGMLSVRTADPDDRESSTAFRRALGAAGFRVGDEVEMVLVARPARAVTR